MATGRIQLVKSLPLFFFKQSDLMQSTEVMDMINFSFQVTRYRNTKRAKWKYVINVTAVTLDTKKEV
jgi:hypothetical protein